MAIDRLSACRAAYVEWRTTYGTSNCDFVERTEHRRRVERENPKLRKKRKWSEYVRLYKRQSGICKLCGREMALIKGKVEIDHVDVNAKPDDFECDRNIQLVCWSCNREKGSMSVPEQAKHYGRTMREIVDNDI